MTLRAIHVAEAPPNRAGRLDDAVDVLTLAGELRKGTIEGVLGMTDFELDLQTTLGDGPSERRTHNIAYNTLPCTFTRMGLPPK
jgi:hypothetical protein